MRSMLFVVVLCALVATPAMADLVLKYDMSNALLTYDVTAQKLTVTDTVGSSLDVRKSDNETLAILDNATINGGDNFDLMLTLNLIDEPGLNNWAGTGSLSFTDISMTNVVEATVQTYNIERSGGYLLIQGRLSELGLNSGLLVNRGDPWTFVGNGELPGEPAEGATNQVAMYNPGSYDGGEVWTIRFGMGTTTLDWLFSANRSLSGGYVGGEVVPVPAAVLLGLLGMGVVGLKLRKRA